MSSNFTHNHNTYPNVYRYMRMLECVSEVSWMSVCVCVWGVYCTFYWVIKKTKNVMPVNKHVHSYLLFYQNILLHQEFRHSVNAMRYTH